MGAAQSKKKRRERKRKKRLQMASPNFDMPRSASVDFIRTHSLALTSCPHCQGLNSSTVGRLAVLGLLHGSHKCTCRHRHYADDEADGYQSCPSYSNSNCCLSIGSAGHSGVASTSGRLDMDRSTMSLNRNLKVRSTQIVQSKSSEFSELFEILQRYEDRKRELASIITPPPSLSHREESSTNLSKLAPPTVTLNDDSPNPSGSLPSMAASTKTTPKKCITLLEDDESRQARWQKQKQMAQQLRNLRRHIQLQEASHQKLPIPFLCDSSDERPQSFGPIDSSDSETSTQKTVEHTHRSRNKFSKMSNYKYLDNHPVLSRLQNEQNNRLESMERRMKEIRLSAMQEAERRKFAEIFPAKQDSSQTERMMQEAKDMLEKIKEEKKKKREATKNNQTQTNQSISIADDDSRTVLDPGEVIPVHIVGDSTSSPVINAINVVEQPIAIKTECKEERQKTEKKERDWLNKAWPNVNLDHPLTWLVLPFLLFPLILRMILSLIVNSGLASEQTAESRNAGHRETKPKR
ncbi:uncharacterized protein LOC106050976 [Biomphalaria glabrata]|uniref:Uncharacterized protein LOC106050976 n=1 Tax=Biomphalaria glabrata TaxID=6526 RepID=A0A9U8DUB0_BIOGL|nr:uncharacterized protein LOC106050976 [Biomphalaria glabrata]XP_013061533.2 uncharacterized protein LOC106050976 [Biomphalaria glabrata]XP_055864330.1 uncharacterized protein LOC106050976 [Biomphalaria glabrata]XP_055864331.1 uncharacterized protein LOC106050976 [Biomphalaria glabrata]